MKKTGLERKSQVDIKAGESFYYLLYLCISKSHNVLVNIYCNFSSGLSECAGCAKVWNMGALFWIRRCEDLPIYTLFQRII